MTDLREFDELADRLVGLGEALDFDDAQIVEVVLQRLDAPEPRGSGRRWLLIAAAVLVGSIGVAVQPDARRTVARWFGLDGFEVQIDPHLSLPPPSPSFDMPGPGESRIVDVDGQQILVSTVTGRWNEVLIAKVVRSTDQVTEVEVDGHQGLWIAGSPHQVMYEAPNGEVVVERVAANTLLWQEGDQLWRVEGFHRLADAVAFAAGT